MEAILMTHLQNYTIIPAIGFYKGVKEKSVVIEVFETSKETVTTVCQMLAQALHQELVVSVEQPCAVNGATKIAQTAVWAKRLSEPTELELKIALDAPKYYTELLEGEE